MLKKLACFFVLLHALTISQAQEIVVLECNSKDSKWAGTVEIDLKNKKLNYDNWFDRFTNDEWNRFKKEYAEKENKEFKPTKYEPPKYLIVKVSDSAIDASPMGLSMGRGDLRINRYTLTLTEKYGEYKCERKQKEF